MEMKGDKNFWKDRNVLITGYEGFLGSHLTRQLLACGARVVGLDIKVRRKNTIFTPGEYGKISIVKGDTADYGLVKEVIANRRIEIVFHLAAEAIVERAQRDPLRAFSSNIKGTWCVLEACRHSGEVEAIVVASSDKAYGSHKDLPYREDTPLQGKHPYDVSKSCSDLLSYTYFHTYNLPVCITRCGNIFGPGDFNFSRIVPDTIRCALTGKTLLIRSDGKFTRDYIYVDDIINGYIILAEKLKKLKSAGEAFNFSDENPVTVKGLVDKIFKIAGKKPNYRVLNIAKYEIRHQCLSSQKAGKILGWMPEYSLKDGLEKTMAWYKEYFLRDR